MSLALIGPIGTPELLIILVVALLMFGGRLPEVAKSLGKSVNQFKRGLKEVDDDVSRPEPPAAPPLPRSLPRETDALKHPDPAATKTPEHQSTPQG